MSSAIMSDNLTVKSLNFIVLHTSDLAAARNYYTQLGFVIVDESPDFVQFASATGEGAGFGIGRLTPETSHEPELWWGVEDADAAYAAAQTQGAEIVHSPVDMPFGRTLAIKDPAGYILHLWQETPPAK